MKGDQLLINSIEKISNMIEKLQNKYFSDSKLSNLSVKQMLYISLISKMNKPTVTELASKLQVTKPTVTNTINRLIDLGYIIKRQDLNDRRFFHLFLSEKGANIIKSKNEANKIFSEKIFSYLNKNELSQIIRIMDKIVNYLSSEDQLL